MGQKWGPDPLPPPPPPSDPPMTIGLLRKLTARERYNYKIHSQYENLYDFVTELQRDSLIRLVRHLQCAERERESWKVQSRPINSIIYQQYHNEETLLVIYTDTSFVKE